MGGNSMAQPGSKTGHTTTITTTTTKAIPKVVFNFMVTNGGDVWQYQDKNEQDIIESLPKYPDSQLR